MTITTGKQAGRRGASQPWLRLAPLAAAAMLLAGECRADWRVHPTFSLTETYTDNVNHMPDDLKRSQLVSEFTPGLVLVGKGRRFQAAASGQWRQFAYSDEKQPNTADHIYEYSFNGRGELVEDWLFVDATASSAPQTISAFGQQPGASLYSLGNRTQIKTWRVSPYIEQRFGRNATMSLRYSRDSVDASNYNAFGSSVGDSISANLASGDAFGKLGWGVSYFRQDLDNKIGGPSSSESASTNLRYALDPKFALTTTFGHDRYDFQSLGGRTAGRNWLLGFEWTPSARTLLSASLGRHYLGQTGKLDFSHRSRYTVWRVGYDDVVTNTRERFLLPSTIDTASMLDRLFSATISDPVQRQLAVAAYIQQTGLPPSLADSINYLSNRYFREKRLQASSLFSRGRSSAALTLYGTERVALSNAQSDSPLLGSQFASLNNNVRQHGLSLTYNYRINARSSVVAAAVLGHSRSITTGVVTDPRDFRLGMTRQLGKDVRAAVEVRRIRGDIDALVGRYRDNSISASLSAQL